MGVPNWLCAALGLALLGMPLSAGAQTRLFPANGARGVSPDTHLLLTFSSPPAIGAAGLIRIYDAADMRLVDTLDMSIPAGPDPARRRPAGSSPDTTVYQLNTIGGVEGFHFFPVIVRGATARITPHSHVLHYGRSYVVRIDAGVLGPKPLEWRFSTRVAGPRADAVRITVAADGSGDFSTVQGAIDFVPDRPAAPVTILIRNGDYEEIVFLRDKSNLVIRGQDRDRVRVGYGNNSAFNPPGAGPNRRPAFSVYNSTGIQLSNFTIRNFFIGQAEALLVSGSRNVIDHMTLNGSGDALNLKGATYIADTLLTGHGDTILSVGPAFFVRTEIRSIGPFNWVRNPAGNHGHVFLDCRFVGLDEPLPWTRTPDGEGQRVRAVLARLPDNKGVNYPFAEMVLINARMSGIAPEGWGPIEENGPNFDRVNIHFWEFNSMDMDGRPLDMSQRHPVARQLVLPRDARAVADYRRPEFILDGWAPVVR